MGFVTTEHSTAGLEVKPPQRGTAHSRLLASSIRSIANDSKKTAAPDPVHWFGGAKFTANNNMRKAARGVPERKTFN